MWLHNVWESGETGTKYRVKLDNDPACVKIDRFSFQLS